MTHLNNKLADALRRIANYDPWGSDEDELVTSFALVQKWANEALAEHDAQPAPAPVQVHVLGELADEIEAAYPNADASNLRAFAGAHPPAPAADGAGWELPPLPEPVIYDRGRFGVCYSADQMQDYARAAIAALRQPVPDGWIVTYHWATLEETTEHIADAAKAEELATQFSNTTVRPFRYIASQQESRND